LDQALYTNQLILDEYKSQIFKPVLNGYGYGWRIMDGMVGTHKDTLTLIIHDGGISGYRSRIVRIPEEQYTIIMLQNISLSTLSQISEKIIAILYDQPFEYPKRSAAELVALEMLNSSVENGLQLYNLLQSERADSVFFSETDFNTVGYQLLGMNALAEAIAIFMLNVSAFPASSNTYDSIGEAYMNNGDYELAIDNYQKVFEKLPGDLNINSTFKKLLFENAQQKLAELYQILNDRTKSDK
jgi:tetratricopeptide (TPR) repeat protein